MSICFLPCKVVTPTWQDHSSGLKEKNLSYVENLMPTAQWVLVPFESLIVNRWFKMISWKLSSFSYDQNYIHSDLLNKLEDNSKIGNFKQRIRLFLCSHRNLRFFLEIFKTKHSSARGNQYIYKLLSIWLINNYLIQISTFGECYDIYFLIAQSAVLGNPYAHCIFYTF